MEFTNPDALTGIPIDRYEVQRPLKKGEGAFGITYKARDTKIGTDVAIKILKISKPDSSWKQEAKKAAKVRNCPYVARPLDFGEAEIPLGNKRVNVRYLVSEFVDDNAGTLRDFLDNAPNLTVDLIVELCKQLCIAIKAMQDAGISHGDLHEGNIMLIPPPEYDPSGDHLIKVVDFGLAASLRGKTQSDIVSLAQIMRHLWELNKNYAGERIWHDKKFSESLPSLISQLEESNPERRLQDPVEIVKRIQEMKEQARNASLVQTKALTDPFVYLSVEEIPEDSDLLSSLFSHDLPWYQEAVNFGTLLISGHRGSGKSMVLKNMRLKTKLMSQRSIDELRKDVFVGFYLHCQHSFYLPFAGKNIQREARNLDMVLHHFNMLFALEIIDSVIRLNSVLKVDVTDTAKKSLFEFINGFLIKTSVNLSGVDLLDHLKTLVEREIKLIERYIIEGKVSPNLSGAVFLRELCGLLHEHVAFFKQRKVYFLLDDFSDARGVSRDVQRSINRVIGFRNENFCFKITTERYAFDPTDLDGHELVQDREFRYIDLGQQYLSYPHEVEEREFVRSILDKRLERSGERQTVEQLFGEYDFPRENIGASLADPETRDQTLYAGFNTIYNLCSGDISTLLELCRDIYRQSKAKRKFPRNASEHIDFKLQDGIIKNFSRDRVAMIKEIQIYGDPLFLIVNALGEISRKYLYEFGQIGKQKGRHQEKIRIEVNGIKKLDTTVVLLYQAMIKFGVFTDAGTGYPWGDIITNVRLIMRRIYAPAFQISFRNRECVRLTPDRFESFLREPQMYSKRGTKFLEDLNQPTLKAEPISDTDASHR